MTKHDLNNIILNGESETVEFKLSFNKRVIETLVAFSNTKGGKVIIGVKNDKTIVGVTIAEETVQKWVNEIKQNTEPAIYPIIDLIKIGSKTVIIFSINEFPIKPIAFKDRYYIRKQNSNHKLTVDEISELRFFSLNYSFDSFNVDTSINQLRKDAIKYFKDKVKDSGRYKFSNDIKQDFVKLGLIRNNKLTRAAELLFGLHFTNIHIGRFKSATNIIDDIMIRSPLILAIDEAMDFIKKNIRLGFEFGGETTKRIEKWQYPLLSIREFLLNAVVHRDYQNPTDVIIKIYDEKIEFTNPGKLMGDLTVDKIMKGNYISQHRNKLLTEAFYLTGDIEKYGTGFRRVNKWLEDYPNLNYELIDLSGFIRLNIYSTKVTDRVTDRVTDKVTDNQLLIIKLIRQNKFISASQMANEVGISKRKIIDNLNKLKEKNIVKRVGSAKGGYWKVLKE